jgi:hypothetical protein
MPVSVDNLDWQSIFYIRERDSGEWFEKMRLTLGMTEKIEVRNSVPPIDAVTYFSEWLASPSAIRRQTLSNQWKSDEWQISYLVSLEPTAFWATMCNCHFQTAEGYRYTPISESASLSAGMTIAEAFTDCKWEVVRSESGSFFPEVEGMIHSCFRHSPYQTLRSFHLISIWRRPGGTSHPLSCYRQRRWRISNKIYAPKYTASVRRRRNFEEGVIIDDNLLRNRKRGQSIWSS